MHGFCHALLRQGISFIVYYAFPKSFANSTASSSSFAAEALLIVCSILKITQLNFYWQRKVICYFVLKLFRVLVHDDKNTFIVFDLFFLFVWQ